MITDAPNARDVVSSIMSFNPPVGERVVDSMLCPVNIKR